MTDFKRIFAKNLNAQLVKHNKTQSDLVNDLDLNKSTVSTWINGTKMPRMNKVEQLALYFGIEKSDLLEEKNISSSMEQSRAVRIPVLGRVVAGIPIDAIQEVLDYEEITPELAATGEFFALKVKGDSMLPKLEDGDIVIVKKQEDVETGDVAIVLVNGNDATIKQVKKVQGGIMLFGFNTDVYEPHFYSDQQIQLLPVSILGKVVESRRTW
ncbi:LexA family protein [Megasphaera hexanoica]|uniref:LexA family protein n=1 Tax=Megasphaera hexanoica TaxID=1675036 RepID=A0ABW7DKQ6_9FIRM|nr:XRE family transcriptional regulator [Megasphaera hexanoica]AXB82294.1 LexA family transcriptional regulator [Megasphaera hexanoica]